MAILNRIENRVFLPGDSDTQRTQKSLTAIACLLAAPFVLINGLANFSVGLMTCCSIFFPDQSPRSSKRIPRQ